MSFIPTKQIDGDVAVGRNVSAGGNANIQGNARVGHDLIVDGWLEARNIKSANKGLFATPTSMMEAYPHPHDGWFCGVAATDEEISGLGLTVEQGKALFRMYVGCCGKWVKIPKLYEIVVDNDQIAHLRDDLLSLRSEYVFLGKQVDAHDTRLEDIGKLHKTIGQAGGIATLDENGKVPEAQMGDRYKRLADMYAASWKSYLETSGAEYSDDYVTLGVFHQGTDDDVETRELDILAATHENAGVMSARDKMKLDALVESPSTVQAMTTEEVMKCCH